MTIPNLIGMNISSSMDKLIPLTDEYSIIIKRTKTPFKDNISKTNECRVIRQKISENSIEIIISYF